MMSRPRLVTAALLICLIGACTPNGPQPTEILWDTWGVPHIYGEDVPGLFYAFGWAQMASHADLLLRMYGEARGRASEYWGEAHLDADRWLHTMEVPKRAQVWYGAQSPEFRGYLDAFAAGINAYASEHSDLIKDELEIVLPVSGVDVMARAQHALHIAFIAGSWAPLVAHRYLSQGSNGWAIGPSRTAGGHTMLLANPHLAWSEESFLYEAHLIAPGIDLYGVSMVGLPVLAIAFNDHLGWTHTVNAISPSNLYELTLEDGGYRFDGEARNFEEKMDTLRILDGAGVMREEAHLTHWSVHGPVIAEGDGKAIAIRVVGLDAPGLLEQWWDMGQAENLAEFEAALRRQQVPIFAVLYADRDGHILHHLGGRVPIREGGNFFDWFVGVQPGDSSQTLWTEIHEYDELPRVVDPPSGWLQNTNDPPWTTTFPLALNPNDFPLNITRPPSFWARAQRSARILAEDDQLTLDDLIDHKHSTRVELADLVLTDLIRIAGEIGGPLARDSADVLEAWDRSTDSDSRGAVLFLHWAQEAAPGMQGLENLFATPWSLHAPFATPGGIAEPDEAIRALERAATMVERDYGALDVPWGEVYRLRGNGLDLPGNGGGDPWGIFRAAFFQRDGDGHMVASGGDTYVAAVEFSEPVRARVLLTYGNASQPHSAHLWDQLELFARKELREAWLARPEIEAHLESQETLIWPDSR